MVDNTGPTYPPNALYWSAKWWTATVLVSTDVLECEMVDNYGPKYPPNVLYCSAKWWTTTVLSIHRMHYIGT